MKPVEISSEVGRENLKPCVTNNAGILLVKVRKVWIGRRLRVCSLGL